MERYVDYNVIRIMDLKVAKKFARKNAVRGLCLLFDKKVGQCRVLVFFFKLDFLGSIVKPSAL